MAGLDTELDKCPSADTNIVDNVEDSVSVNVTGNVDNVEDSVSVNVEDSVNDNVTSNTEDVADSVNDNVSSEVDNVIENVADNTAEDSTNMADIFIPEDVNNIVVDKLFVLISKYGYSGAFLEKEHAELYIKHYSKDLNFIIREFMQTKPIINKEVWVAVDNYDMPFYVGDRSEAERVYLEIKSIGYAHEYNIDEYKQDIGFAEHVKLKISRGREENAVEMQNMIEAFKKLIDTTFNVDHGRTDVDENENVPNTANNVAENCTEGCNDACLNNEKGNVECSNEDSDVAVKDNVEGCSNVDVGENVKDGVENGIESMSPVQMLAGNGF
jgi:hypothetical protein